MKVGSLFAGYGGIDLGLNMIWPDARPAWFVEFDKHPSAILAQRFPGVVNLGDITAVDWDEVEPVDILTGGFPCQDVSHAGNRAGIKPGTRSGLWSHMAYAIQQLQPRLVVIENVSGLLSADAAGDVEPCPWCLGDEPASPLRALGAVLADLAEAGFDAAEWASVRASDAGAPHRRERVFIVAAPHASRERLDRGWYAGQGWGLEPTDSGNDAVVLLPTPHADFRDRSPETAAAKRQNRDFLDVSSAVLNLLPTPAVNDMGAGKTVEWWDEWAARQKAADGRPAPHGKSLAIEAQRLLPTPAARDHKGPNPNQRTGGVDLPTAVADFGPYGPAIARWEAVLGRPAPSPTEPNKDGRPRLSPRFVEFMMGLPDGWVTDTGIPRNAQLKALGNGVVPQQLALALSILLPRLEETL